VGQINFAELIPPQMLAIYLLYFVGGFGLYASLLAGIGAISTSMKEGQQISTIIILPAVSPLWFLTAFIVDPNSALVKAVSLFPLSSPLGMIFRTGFTDVPAAEIAASLLILYATLAIAVWASAKVFRASILMYGKRPGAREVVSMLKRA
jgi:ABC-2 type transport system permease protein